MKVKFYTLGCKVNQYESQAMGEALTKRGFTLTQNEKEADIFVVNSCTVTAMADSKTRQTVRRYKKLNPHGIVVLTGCMPQAYPEKSAELTEADIILGNKTNESLCDTLEDYIKGGIRKININIHKTGDPFCGDTISRFEERTRAYVKIQDGCNRFCSYCAIPYARGRVRSKPLEVIKSELEILASNGYKEVVLVGINLSSYGSDIGITFSEAVAVAEDINGIERVRLGSLEPDHLTDEVIEALSKCKKLCPQFHISLQSGCDNTLKRMNRHYTADEYRMIAKKLRQCFPDCTLTTDVMVGFAGETSEDFEESLQFVKEITFEKVHVFPYSIRKGTKAEKLAGHIDKKTKEERCHIMIAAAEEIRATYLQSQVGKVYPVLFETTLTDGYRMGYTPNYTPVKVKSDNINSGDVYEVKIIGVDKDGCIGTLNK